MGKHVVSDAEDEVEYEREEDREPVEGDAVEGRDDDEEDEDDEEGQDEYEKDGFIGDDVDEEEEEEEEERADSDEERQKKKKKRKKKLHEGDILTCKIKSIQKNRYQVFLICRESEMRNNRHQHVQNLDTYYHEDRSNHQSEQEKAQKEKELAKKHFKPRMIVHPRFQNITADEAMQCLSDKDPGESIIRHSSRGPSYLTLTLKVYDGVYAHKDIVEGGKEHKDITSLLRIGKTLKIGEDTLGDGPIC